MKNDAGRRKPLEGHQKKLNGSISQMIIRDFGKDKYGAPMFFPNSDAWRKKMGK